MRNTLPTANDKLSLTELKAIADQNVVPNTPADPRSVRSFVSQTGLLRIEYVPDLDSYGFIITDNGEGKYVMDQDPEEEPTRHMNMALWFDSSFKILSAEIGMYINAPGEEMGYDHRIRNKALSPFISRVVGEVLKELNVDENL